VPLHEDGVDDVDLGDGEAKMSAEHLRVRDFFNIPNGLFRFMSPASVAAKTSFDIRWFGPVTNRSKVSDPNIGFAGAFVLSHATMTWSASNADGFRFRSNSSGTTSVFAQLGSMRNGIFFDHNDASDDD
jgi:hypothetical protein